MVRQQDESPTEYAADADFHARVRRAERSYIRARRQAAARTPRERTNRGEPEHDAIGLAFSGGGIRSATFNLGVLQALHAAGFFAHVDYLSTVSGGGFVGASLSHAMRRPGAGFPFASRADDPRVDGPVEAPAVSYLRTRSNYLAPQGVPDLVRLVAVLMRGLLVNLLFVVLPILALIATLAAVVYGPGVRAELLGHPFAPVRLMPGAIAIALAWVALPPVVVAFAPDEGVEVDISPAALHLDAHGRSRRHLAVGRIHYPADARYAREPMVGWLVYVKSSLVGEEDALVHDYRRASPTFPHETTADQFFSEEQFEAYRALGHHIAAAVFGEGPPLAIGSTPRADAIDAGAGALAARLRGDARCSTATGSTPAE